MKNLILYFFLLIPRVLFNSSLSYIDKNSEVIKNILKKSLQPGPKQRVYLALMIKLILLKANLSLKKKTNR